MKRKLANLATLALIAGLAQGMALGQTSKTSEPLGDVARQLKAQRAKPQEKPKVFTSDDLTAPKPSPEHPVASPASPSPASAEAKPEEKPAREISEKGAREAAPVETEEAPHGEKYFRDRMGKLQDRLEVHRRELSVLEQKLGQKQMMYYPDPNKGLLQESGPTAMSDVHKLQARITQKKADIAADQQAVSDLREQLRREGGDAGWLR